MSFNNYYLKCPIKNCSWLFKSLCLNKFRIFKVRKFCNIHTCPLKNRMYSKRQSASDVLDVVLMGKYSDTKTIYTPSGIQADMKRAHEISLTYMQAWRDKQKAFKILRGDPV